MKNATVLIESHGLGAGWTVEQYEPMTLACRLTVKAQIRADMDSAAAIALGARLTTNERAAVVLCARKSVVQSLPAASMIAARFWIPRSCNGTLCGLARFSLIVAIQGLYRDERRLFLVTRVGSGSNVRPARGSGTAVL
jgi:hypothetical protein